MVQVPELGTSLFILPNNGQFETKNSHERIVMLNSIARRTVDEQRGKHREPDIARLLETAEKVCEPRPNTVLRGRSSANLTQSLTHKDSGRVIGVQAVDV